MDMEEARGVISVKLNHIIITVAPHMHLLRVHPCHDVGGIMAPYFPETKVYLLKELPVLTIEHKEAIAMPFGLIDLPLIVASPKVVTIIQLLLRQRDFSLDVPTLAGHHAHGSRKMRSFSLSQLKLGIDPDL